MSRNVDDSFTLSNNSYRNNTFNLAEDEVDRQGVAGKEFTKADLMADYIDSDFKDVDGEVIDFIGVELLDDSQGVVEITQNGIRFVPAENFTGEATFVVTASEGNNEVTFENTVKIWAENDAPVVELVTQDMLEDTTMEISGSELLENASDAEGDAMRIVGVWNQSTGTASYDAETDTLTFTPAEHVFGPAWIEYIVEDSNGAFTTARIDVTIENTEDAAIAQDDLFALSEDQSYTFTTEDLIGNDVNLDQGTLRIESIDSSTMTEGQVTLLADGRVEYIAAADYSGEQQFRYTLVDEYGNRSDATVTLAIAEVNDAPEVSVQTLTSKEDEVLTLSQADLLQNATDIEGDWMNVVGVRSAFGGVEFDDDTRQIHFTPPENFNSVLYGEVPSLEYLVVDENGGETWATLNIDVTPVNDPPQGVDDLLFVWESGPGGYTNVINSGHFLVNDIEVDGESIHIADVANGPSSQVGLINNNAQVTYQAAADFIGQDQFTYQVSDGQVNEDGTPSVDWATVTVEVVDNTAPVASDFLVTAAEDTILRFDVADILANVTDVDLGNEILPEQLTLVGVGNSEHGDVRIENGQVVFTPNAHYNSQQHGGLASFTYIVSDIVGNRASAEALINYTPVNDAPVATDKYLGEMQEDGQGFVFTRDQLLSGDIDVDDDVLSIANISATNGTVTEVADGIYRFNGDLNFNGTATINYTVTDGSLNDQGSAQINVTPVNDAPWVRQVGYDVEFNGQQQTLITPVGYEARWNSIGGLLGSDAAGDVDGDNIHIEVISTTGGVQIQEGLNTRITDGQITWLDNTPDDNGSITYVVVDEHGSKSAPMTINVETEALDKPAVIEYAWRSVPYFTGIRGQTQPRTYTVKATDGDGDDSDVRIYTTDSNWEVSDNSSGGAVFRWRGSGFDGWSPINSTPNSIPEFSQYDEFHSGRYYDMPISIVDGAGNITEEILRVSVSIWYSASDSVYNILEEHSRMDHNGNLWSDKHYAPIVFDLTRDGLALTAAADGIARYDWDGDGDRSEQTGWIAGQGDAVLAYDYDGDGIIQYKDEISFVDYLEGARTDLEGMHAFDSDGDGLFTANDEKWSEFGLWVDDGDALSEAGEFRSLDEMGIASLNLTSDGEEETMNGNIIFGMTEVTMTDGSTLEAGDIAFQVIDNGLDPENDAMFTDQEDDTEARPWEGIVLEDKTDDAMFAAAVEAPEVEETKDVVTRQNFIDSINEGTTPTPESPSLDTHSTSDVAAADDLPSDEELDQMIAQAASDSAAMQTGAKVVEVSDDPESASSDAKDEDEPLSMVG